jgi:hypothetical protein
MVKSDPSYCAVKLTPRPNPVRELIRYLLHALISPNGLGRYRKES